MRSELFAQYVSCSAFLPHANVIRKLTENTELFVILFIHTMQRMWHDISDMWQDCRHFFFFILRSQLNRLPSTTKKFRLLLTSRYSGGAFSRLVDTDRVRGRREREREKKATINIVTNCYALKSVHLNNSRNKTLGQCSFLDHATSSQQLKTYHAHTNSCTGLMAHSRRRNKRIIP